MSKTFDVIVAGAGLMGLSSAYSLARRGLSVCLLEQASSGNHTHGGSHGETRIIRLVHGEPIYLEMARESYRLWTDLEHQVGVKLFENHGLLWLNKTELTNKYSAVMKEHNAPHEVLNNEEIQQRYPQFQYGPEWSAILDHTAGTLYARKCLDAFRKQLERLQVPYKYECQIQSYETDGKSVTVNTNQGVVQAKSLVLTVGAWMDKLVPEIPLKIQPKLVGVFFWDVKKTGRGFYDVQNRCPNLLFTDEENHFEVNMIPDQDFPGKIKSCAHGGPVFDPSLPRPTITPSIERSQVSNHLREHLGHIEYEKPSIQFNCQYAVTPDEDFLIDRHPQHDNVILCSGFSGCGFKFGAVMGEIVSDLVQNKTPKHDLHLFSAKRVSNKQ